MLIYIFAAALMVVGTASPPPAPPPSQADIARANYIALLNGQKRPSDLSASELADVAALDREARRRDPATSVPANCRASASTMTQLEQRLNELRCSEYRR